MWPLRRNLAVKFYVATGGRGSGVVGYNVQVAVNTEHHLIVAHQVTNNGSDRSQLANIASQAKDVLGTKHLDAVADRGYFNSPEILACEQANITVTLPKPMTSRAKADGRFGKQDFASRAWGRICGDVSSLAFSAARLSRGRSQRADNSR
jgi:hypothetical protein